MPRPKSPETVDAAVALQLEMESISGTKGYAANLFTQLCRVVRISRFPQNCKGMKAASEKAVKSIGGKAGIDSARFSKKAREAIEGVFDNLNRQLAEQADARAEPLIESPLPAFELVRWGEVAGRERPLGPIELEGVRSERVDLSHLARGQVALPQEMPPCDTE